MDDWAPTRDTIMMALDYIHRFNIALILDVMLSDHNGNRSGRPRMLPSWIYLLGFYLNAMRPNSRGCIRGAARAIYAIPDELKRQLQIPDDVPMHLWNHRFSNWFTAVTRELSNNAFRNDGAGAPDMFTICQLIVRSALPDEYLRWPSIAIDGTDVGTFATVHIAPDSIVLDGDAVYDDEGVIYGGEAGPPPWEAPDQGRRRARVFGIGQDGRAVLTKDWEARPGYRTGTRKRPAGTFVGFELTLAVPMPVAERTDGVTSITLGPPASAYYLGFNLTPAGTHRGHASLPIIEYLHNESRLGEVAADRGITLMRGYLEALRAADINSVHSLAERQRQPRAGPTGSVIVDGTLLSDAAPAELLHPLKLPPRHASPTRRARLEARFNHRAAYRWTLHDAPRPHGRLRFACPICQGCRLRCPDIPVSMRSGHQRPLVTLPAGRTGCCGHKTLAFGPTEFPLWMRTIFGTTAYNVSYGRRNLVESANSLLHGVLINLDDMWAEVFGTAPKAFLIAFALMGLNHLRNTAP